MAVPLALEVLALLAGLVAFAIAALTLVHNARSSRLPVEPAGAWRPKASVIVPARGEHQGFADNVRAFAVQEYPDFELLFVVDSADDPAAVALRALQRDLPRLRVVLTEPAQRQRGFRTGKMAAQMTGFLAMAADSEVVVFADADARPSPRWLASMVAPLHDASVGAVTGFQAYSAAAKPTVWTALRDALVNMVQMAMTLDRARYLWGGSMAVRKVDFARSGVEEHWRRWIADDTGLTKAIKGLGLKLAFAPGAIVRAPEDWSRREVLDWVVKEYALIRDIDPALYKQGARVAAVSILGTLTGLALVLARPTPLLGLAGFMLLAPTLLAAPSAWFRWRLATRAQPSLRSRPLAERAMVLLWAPLLPFVKPYGLLRSARTRAISWRGSEYAVAAQKR